MLASSLIAQLAKHEHASELLAHGGDHLELASGVGVGGTVLNVDYADNAIAPNNRSRKKRLEGILR